MRIDVISIFPEYLAPLGLSLAGKAQESGLLDVHVHDLRDWTHDRHRTVDDTPYGGGAGMVMKPEPWGEALDAVVPAGATRRPPDARRTHPLGRAVHPGGRRRAGHPRAPRLRVRTLRGHRPAGDGRRRHRGWRCASSRSATTCSTAARSPRWRSSRPSYACCPGSWATRSPSRRSRTPTVCWSTPSTPSPRPGAATRSPTYCSPATTPGSRGGATPSPYDAPPSAAPTSPTPRARSTSATLAEQLALAVPADAGELLTLQRACWVQEQQANPGVEHPGPPGGPADVQAWMQEWTTLVLRAGGSPRRCRPWPA